MFQDPYSSLNPRMTVGGSLAEHLRNQAFGEAEPYGRASTRCSTSSGSGDASRRRYPHELSGGQRQRAVIARAISTRPDFLVADEPVSALDVSIRAQIMNLIRDLQAGMGLTLLFISHDLSVVAHLSRRIAVMYLGQVMEVASREALFRRAAASLHACAALGRPDPRSGARKAPAPPDPDWRNPQPGGCARRMPAADALPAGE